ncbi:hypothetical protein [Pseudanabaena sp. ABRG5-3]|uniref:PFE-CTERM domain-containing protein n=1 Tax=Pseudanabaena sp. ABRG5-3 TaxID=685565 RepID=UPI000DC717F5|nr:hypothetical protein [Pseudanabaena sp. ABRG5-3]BBC25679.1 hypothetical protein ABRG53_3422 [Pseudanabaena sp. ABRG5-3]
MKLLDKIIPRSLSVAGLALALAASPVNAQSFQIGNKEGIGEGTPILGQQFDIGISGNFSIYNGNAQLNYIKFLYDATSTSDPLVQDSVRLLLYSSIPLVEDIQSATGTTLIAASDSNVTIPADPDFDFSGVPNTFVSRQFNFSSLPELTSGTTYFAFFSFDPVPVDPMNWMVAPQTVKTTAQSYYGSPYDSTLAPIGLSPSGNQTVADSNFIVGLTPVPFEFEASGGIAILGGLFAVHKLRQRKQNNNPDEQPDNQV